MQGSGAARRVPGARPAAPLPLQARLRRPPPRAPTRRLAVAEHGERAGAAAEALDEGGCDGEGEDEGDDDDDIFGAPPPRLRDPVLLAATASSRVAAPDAGGEAALSSYMTLPVEQYFVLDPGLVERLGPQAFRCTIPRMTFLSVWLEPQVDVEVRITATGVRMRSTAARLRGSDFVARSGLNESVDLAWRTVLTWGGGGDGGNGGGGGGGGHIRVRTSVAVWAEVLPPFHLVPRAVLTAACAAVLRRAVPALLDAFARSLADDYRRWASEPAYRRQRAEAAEAAAGRAGGAAAAMGGERMDTSLPPSLVRRVVRAKLRALQPPAAAPGAAPPRDVPVARDALAALGDAAAIFVHFLADGAQAHARAAKRATMTADDVLKALADAEFADFEQGMAGVVAEVKHAQQEAAGRAAEKRKRKAAAAGGGGGAGGEGGGAAAAAAAAAALATGGAGAAAAGPAPAPDRAGAAAEEEEEGEEEGDAAGAEAAAEEDADDADDAEDDEDEGA